MVTKRTPLIRSPTFRVPSSKAAELFRDALVQRELANKADAIADKANPNRNLQTPERSEYYDLHSALNRELGAKLWQISPLDVHGSWKAPQAHEDAEDWHEAQRLRAALLAAAGLDPD
jgi:hypothetical protein